MPGWKPSELCQYVRYLDAAVNLLDELTGLGFKHKTLEHIRFSCYPGTASWQGMTDDIGYMTIHEGCEPGAVAHELGHGFHERLRNDYSLENRFGEAHAETIRWFTEDKLGNPAWCEKFKNNGKDDEILKLCNYDWKQYKNNLSKKKFFPP